MPAASAISGDFQDSLFRTKEVYRELAFLYTTGPGQTGFPLWVPLEFEHYCNVRKVGCLCLWVYFKSFMKTVPRIFRKF